MAPRAALGLLTVVLIALVGGVLLYLVTSGGDDHGGGDLVVEGPAETAEDRPGVDLVAPGEQDEAATPETARSVVDTAAADETEPSAKAAPTGPRVRGRVVDKFGAGVPSARVVMAGPGFFPLTVDEVGFDGERWEAETDQDGFFALQGPPAGTARVAVFASGYAPFSRSDLPLPAGDEVELEPLMISMGAILTGRVVDPDGAGVAGAKLRRQTDHGEGMFLGYRTTVAVTGADGSFRVDQLACGAWKIMVESEDHPNRPFEGFAEVPGHEYDGYVFELQAGDHVSGVVRGIPANHGEHLQVRARLRQDSYLGFGSGGVRTCDVAADGTFEVRGLKIGEAYSLRVQSKREDAGPWNWGGSSRSESVNAKAGDEGVELVYRPEAALTFRVLDAETMQPVTDFRVEVGIDWKQTHRGEDEKPLLKHPDGRVRVGNLRPSDPEDRVHLEVIATGYERYLQDDIEVALGQALDLGEILLQPVPVLRVTVLDSETRAPVVGAKVELEEQRAGGREDMRSVSISLVAGEVFDFEEFGGENAHTGTTDENGVAVVTSLPGKTCVLQVTAEGFARLEKRDLALPVKGDAEERVLLLPGGSVLVHVVGPDGKPLPGAEVVHRDLTGPVSGEVVFELNARQRPITDQSGEVRFDNLTPGNHGFRLAEGGGMDAIFGTWAAPDGASDREGLVEVVEGETAELTLVAAPKGTLVGRIREGGLPLSGATVRLTRRSPEQSMEAGIMSLMPVMGGGSTGRTDGDGLYEVRDLEEGSYDLVINHPLRHMTDRFEVEVRGGENRRDFELSVAIVEGRITDQDGKPLAGIRVSARTARPENEANSVASAMFVMASDDGEVVSFGGGEDVGGDTAETDEDGRYRLRGVTPDIELQIDGEGSFVEPGSSEPFTVGVDQVKTGVDFSLEVAGQVKVEVSIASEEGFTFASVNATHLPEEGEEAADPVRDFLQGDSTVLEGLTPGRWSVQVRPVGMQGNDLPAQTQEVEVKAREEAVLTFTFD